MAGHIAPSVDMPIQCCGTMSSIALRIGKGETANNKGLTTISRCEPMSKQVKQDVLPCGYARATRHDININIPPYENQHSHHTTPRIEG
jgi:hypothetical protein